MYTKTLQHGEIQYLVRYPDGYKDGEKYPVLLYLHGAGYRYSTPAKMEASSFFVETAKRDPFPFVTVAPICSADTWFDLFSDLKGLLREIQVATYADPCRIYLMGASMGGYTSWQLAMSCPDAFAAMVPICGGGMYWNAARLASIPIWAHHGALDTTVLPEESKKMVDAARRAGADAKLTVYDDVAHPAWMPVFKSNEVFTWLLSHKRIADDQISDTTAAYGDGAKFG